VSIFKEWQPLYAEKGVATFPVGEDKKPHTRNYLRTGLRGSKKLAEKFCDANAFGFGPGQSSGITVMDIDTRNETVLADVQRLYGPSPIIVQTGRGYHIWYKHRGERRLIRPDPERPIDILGGGFVIAPPSQVAKGEYRIIQGTLDDLDHLPPLHHVPDGLRWQRMRDGDGRYVEIRRACQREVRYVDSHAALLDWALTRNLNFMEPLPEREVMHAVEWAWAVQTEGRNWANNQQITVQTAVLKILFAKGLHDSVLLLTYLRFHHWGHKRFPLATKAMAARYSWGLSRFWEARDALTQLGIIKLVQEATHNRPAIYGWGTQSICGDTNNKTALSPLDEGDSGGQPSAEMKLTSATHEVQKEIDVLNQEFSD
jgi:Bifunctional DNA primase/polymerase, N-terminal